MLGSDAVLHSIAEANSIDVPSHVISDSTVSPPDYLAYTMSTLIYLLLHDIDDLSEPSTCPSINTYEVTHLTDALTCGPIIKLVTKALEKEDRQSRSLSKCMKRWTSAAQYSHHKYSHMKQSIKEDRLSTYASAIKHSQPNRT